MTKQTIILISLFSIVIAGILISAFFGVVEIEPIEESEQIEYQFKEPKDWFLDSTMTEKRHIYYETQYKMK